MNWIREHINRMPSFGYLNNHISTIEDTVETNPDLCIEVCKSLIESICKTILTNQSVVYNIGEKFQILVKQTIEHLLIDENYEEEVSELVRRIASVSQQLCEMRNLSGFCNLFADVEKFCEYCI